MFKKETKKILHHYVCNKVSRNVPYLIILSIRCFSDGRTLATLGSEYQGTETQKHQWGYMSVRKLQRFRQIPSNNINTFSQENVIGSAR